MRWLRNQVVAPLTEELVFRACMLPMLVPCAGPSTAIFTCPLFFGVGECKLAASKQLISKSPDFHLLLVCLCDLVCLTGVGSTFSPCDWAPALQTRDHLRNFSFCRYVKTSSMLVSINININMAYNASWLFGLVFQCSSSHTQQYLELILRSYFSEQVRRDWISSFHVWLLELNSTNYIITCLYIIFSK